MNRGFKSKVDSSAAPQNNKETRHWIPAFAGMTAIVPLCLCVIFLFLAIAASPAWASDDIAVKEYHCHRTPTGKYLKVRGTVQNNTGHAIDHVKITVICRKWSDEVVDAGWAKVHPSSLKSDGEGAFEVKIPYNGEIDLDNFKFEIGYKDASNRNDTQN